MTLQERMQKAVEHWEKTTGRQFERRQLIDATGAGKGTVSVWFVGNTQTISQEFAVKAAAFLMVKTRWLVSGEGSMERDMVDEACELLRECSPEQLQSIIGYIEWTIAKDKAEKSGTRKRVEDL